MAGSSCRFENNVAQKMTTNGVGNGRTIYLTKISLADLFDVGFDGHWAVNYGGALYAGESTALAIDVQPSEKMGAPAMGSWDRDSDRFPDWFWPGARDGTVPAGFKAGDYDCDDGDSTTFECP